MTTELPPDELPWDALAGYFAGELSAEEISDLDRWIAADPARTELVDQLRQVWTETGGFRQTWNAESALGRIKQTPVTPARVIRLPRFYREDSRAGWHRTSRVAIRAAAAIAIMAGGGWMVWHGTELREPAPATSEVATPRGQRASLRLPDGTRVLLGPSSTIRYAIAADRGARSVSLQGDAYFVVTHDADRPFTVRTRHGIATDLGTRFGVHAYSADSTMEVVVAEGTVSLAAAGDTLSTRPLADSLLLTPGDLGRVSAGGRLTGERGVAVDRYLSWTEGRLEFRDTPLRDVIVQLGRWYDLDLRLGAGLGSMTLSASFKDESAPEVLRLITASLDLRADRQGNVVTIRPK